MPVIYIDIAIAIVLLCFLYRGFTNGFLKEVSAIVGIVGGFFLAGIYALDLAVYLNTYISGHTSYPIAFASIIILTMLGVSMITRVIESLLKITIAGWIDHLLGAFLGFTNGVIIICFVIFIVASISSHGTTFLQSSMFLPYYDIVMEFVTNFMATNYVIYPIS